MAITVCKSITFDAAHRLPWHQGKCSNLHGHTWRVQVGVTGFTNKNGIVVDFKELKTFLVERVEDVFDHHYLNDFIDNPTAENISEYIFKLLKEWCSEYRLIPEFVKVYESEDSYAMYCED